MKLCITATGPDLDSMTDISFGRAPWLLIVDSDSLAVGAVENNAANASQGAGIAAAQLIADRGAEELLTGRVGPKARDALQAANIRIYEGLGSCTVKEAVRQFKQGMFSAETGYTAASAPGRASGGGGGRGGGRGMGRGRGMGMGRGQGGRGGM